MTKGKLQAIYSNKLPNVSFRNCELKDESLFGYWVLKFGYCLYLGLLGIGYLNRG